MVEHPGDGATHIALRFLEDHPEEAARLLEANPPRDAAGLLALADPAAAARALRCAAPGFAVGCLAALPVQEAGAVLEALPLGHAAALLRRLPDEERQSLLQAAPRVCGEALERVLRYPEGTAGSLMNPRVVSLPSDLAVGDSVERLRRTPPDDLYYLYVVDRGQKLVGVVTYRQLLMAEPDAALAVVMHQPVARISASARGEALSGHSGWRLYLALPVVDEDGVLIGAVHRDVLLELERRAAAAAGGPPGAAALGLAEVVWLGLSRTLDGLIGPGGDDSGPPGGGGRE